MGAINSILNGVEARYVSLNALMPAKLFLGIKLFFFAVLIALSVYVIWLFYKALSKRNFIALNLSKYNTSEHPVARKLLAVLFYFVEYILIMPALILVWFIVFSIILLILASARSIEQILMLSGALVMAIRILAYYKEEISQEIAKLFPFIALSVFLLTPGIFEISGIFNKAKEVPLLIESTLLFLLSIFIVEIVFRVGYTIYEIAQGKEDVGDDED